MGTPAFVWCFSLSPDDERLIDTAEPPADHPFRWLHLDLSDQRTVRWLENSAQLPPKLHAMMLRRDGDEHFVTQNGGIALVMQDFEHGLGENVGQIGTLHVALVDGMLLTGRFVPLRCPTLIQRRLESGRDVTDAPSALAAVFDGLAESLAALVLELDRQLLRLEAELLANDVTPNTRDLVMARRQLAQLHRVTGGMRTLLQRIEADPYLPPALLPVIQAAHLRLTNLKADVIGAQQQLRLLREELDLQTAQRTNENVYLLSILTAIIMPATLVTGFFGMNTSGLPFAQGSYGTLLATGTAVLSAAATYWLLKRLGLIRAR